MKTSASFLILALAALIPLASVPAQIHLSGFLEGVLLDTTYILDSTITVQIGDSLVIQPGARILFGGWYKFQVMGYLYAVGTPQDSIIFGPAGPDSIGSLTFGSGVSMVGASRACVLSYCRISGFAGSAINCYYGGITISHCTIAGNRAQWGGGIYLRSDSSLISDCIISDNQCRKNGGGIYCTGAAPTITNCVISNNVCNLLHGDSGHGGGGLCANHFSSPIIANCTFSGNHSNSAGGGLTLNDASYAVLSHCVISNNSADSSGGGIAILKSEYNPSAPIITNCTIAGNEALISSAATPAMGGGLYIQGSAPILTNCIISGSKGESAVCFDSSGFAVMEYCDFYNPLTDDIEGSFIPEGMGQLIGLNANGDSCDVYHNILMNPQFVNPGAENYHLLASSPCIDAGDPGSPLDPDSTVADIGAFYYHQTSAFLRPPPRNNPDTYLLAQVYPNPFNPATVILYELRAASLVSLKVYDTNGRLLNTLVNGRRQAGSYQATFDGSNLASGIYLYRLTAGMNTASGKLVLMK